MLLVIKVDYMSSEKGYRDFENKTFFVEGVNEDDCQKKLKKHFSKIKADHINFPDTDKLIVSSENKPENNNLYIS